MGEDAIAVHFRHGNGERTVVPPDINWFFGAVDAFLINSPESKIFLCTDCKAVIDAFRDRYSSRIICTKKKYPALGVGGMHVTSETADRLMSAEEAILDIWLISRCKYVVGSKSFFTGVAMKLNSKIERSNIKIWMPKNRSHRPLKTHVQVVKCPSIRSRLEASGLLLDGLFFEPAESDKADGGKLFYLYELLAEFQTSDEIDVSEVSLKLKQLRLY